MTLIESYRPLRPERVFKPGQTVIWNPPAGAYSAASAQSFYAGQTASVLSVVNDDQVMLLFGASAAMLANTAYLET